MEAFYAEKADREERRAKSAVRKKEREEKAARKAARKKEKKKGAGPSTIVVLSSSSFDWSCRRRPCRLASETPLTRSSVVFSLWQWRCIF
jgi:hypothetical protein